jgi:SAM-dependent methyltransferase
MIPERGISARAAYDALAPIYDCFTADYDHETWLARLLAATEAVRGRGPGVLDVGCGTGRSCEPLIRRGFDVSACDISPAMLAVARRRLGTTTRRVFAADMRALPECGRFDLITCLDDAVNYLLTDADLTEAFSSVSRLLRPGGVYVFDTNTLRTHRTAFVHHHTVERGRWSFDWRGEGRTDSPAGALVTATLRATSAGGSITARHTQRHHPIRAVCERLRAAGLDVVSVFGQTTGAVLHRRPDDHAHTKTVFIARRPSDRLVRQEAT